ncbi:hypothetical protein A8E97_22175 [Burkholderia cenocepacia]|nr:hypothetical protein A8E88_08450 [Burkholderia cenocepacia]ONV92994.1 hypothetical protein A8E89_12720 [Burkholderia cenocepacia]ONW03596.1 hypothetical protein A8E94_33985 [Burkholderia cenocepacia]ONW31061.1 hypothetical protein A8E93_30180 [Burkholderia cenocepacia]ONW34606.1 hypothetical protein A8E99_29815 [Burkholderia cenocepacia]
MDERALPLVGDRRIDDLPDGRHLRQRHRAHVECINRPRRRDRHVLHDRRSRAHRIVRQLVVAAERDDEGVARYPLRGG